MNFLCSLIPGSDTNELASIPSGQLFLVRGPNSPKSNSECLVLNGALSIRKTTTEFNYQLVVEKIYEEGEEDTSADDDDDSDEGEWSFLIDPSLRISYTTTSDLDAAGTKNPQIVIVWKNLTGEPGEQFRFICDPSTKSSELDKFDLVARQSQYERKYKKPAKKASGVDLEEFEYPFEKPIALVDSDTDNEGDTVNTIKDKKTVATKPKPKTVAAGAKSETPTKKDAPVTEEIPDHAGKELHRAKISLHMFDGVKSVFVEQLSKAEVTIYDLGNFDYWLEVTNDNKKYLGVPITGNINPYFNYEHMSFVFNFITETTAVSWLLKFDNFDSLDAFQTVLIESLWEHNNKQKWVKIKEDEREYLVDSFQDFKIDDEDIDLPDEDEEDEEYSKGLKQSNAGEDFDEGYDELKKFEGKGKNSQLAVGHSNNRTYVVRDNKLGVFKQTDDNELEFQTTIDNIATPKGKSFVPEKVMLHTRDKAMVIQDPDNLNSLYRMDIEYGKIVDEWEVSDTHKVRAFAPVQKYAQTTDEQSLLATSDNAVFKIDPRLSGTKMVESNMKSYATKVGFSALASTEKGYIAVASQKGEIRLYDRLGINAKTQLPAMGDPITGIDVSSDGKWILATCKTYILLIDATIKEGKNEGQIGFLKSFGKDSKPRPKRLQISPEHLAHIQSETKKPLSFTKAHFNAGIDSREQTIVTSSGPYVITWSLRKILRGDKSPYLIKRYSDNVAADNFKFGSDRKVIIALDDDVGMDDRRTFRAPTRESLLTPSKRIQPLSRNSIVKTL